MDNKKVPHKDAKKFGGHAKKLPTRILAAGLGPALAFLAAKGKDSAPLRLLVDNLSDWIKERIVLQKQEAKDLLERIVHNDCNFLRRATDEVLAYMVWLNRFAEAEGLTDEEMMNDEVQP